MPNKWKLTTNETAGMADVAKTCLLGSSRSPISGGCTRERFLDFGRPARAYEKHKWAACKKRRCDKRTRIMRGGIKCVVASGVKDKVGVLGQEGSKVRYYVGICVKYGNISA